MSILFWIGAYWIIGFVGILAYSKYIREKVYVSDLGVIGLVAIVWPFAFLVLGIEIVAKFTRRGWDKIKDERII